MSAVLVDSRGRGHDVTAAIVREPEAGIWTVRGAIADDGEGITGACVFKFGGVDWHGTIDPQRSGKWGERYSFRLVSGANGWGKPLKAKPYHSDSGVRPRMVVEDAASECGETVGSVAGVSSLGVDYARPSGRGGTASIVLDHAAGSVASWWVGRDGLTYVGARPAAKWGPVLDWDPATQRAVFEADDLSTLSAGVEIVDDRVGAGKKLRELEVRIQGSTVRAFGRCESAGPSYGRLSRVLKAIVRRHTEGPLWGTYRYRVASMAPDKRVNLQVARKSSGVPDVLPVKMWPGLAGADVTLAQGAEVLVEFEEGDRGKPFVSHFTPVGGDGFVPVSVSLCGGTRPAAAVGSGVTIFMTPGTPVAVTGTVGGAQFVGTAVFAAPLRGVISDGSPRVRIP
jgi:hypothetical protein